MKRTIVVPTLDDLNNFRDIVAVGARCVNKVLRDYDFLLLTAFQDQILSLFCLCKLTLKNYAVMFSAVILIFIDPS